jgi:hypothetical protein
MTEEFEDSNDRATAMATQREVEPSANPRKRRKGNPEDDGTFSWNDVARYPLSRGTRTMSSEEANLITNVKITASIHQAIIRKRVKVVVSGPVAKILSGKTVPFLELDSLRFAAYTDVYSLIRAAYRHPLPGNPRAFEGEVQWMNLKGQVYMELARGTIHISFIQM